MRNIKLEVKGTTLVITVDLTKHSGLSKSGKNVLIASSGGNVSVPGHEDVKIGLNVYKAAEED